MKNIINIIVKNEENGNRIDSFISKKEKKLSRTRIKNLIIQKNITLTSRAIFDDMSDWVGYSDEYFVNNENINSTILNGSADTNGEGFESVLLIESLDDCIEPLIFGFTITGGEGTIVMVEVDGGEGGTGAAPPSFADHVSLPFKIGFKRVYSIFMKHQLNDQITWIGSAKLGFPDRAIVSFAMGCDLINIGREAMLSIGCIQAQQCHTGHCPTGITTHNKRLQRGLDIHSKSKRFSNYIIGLRKEILQLTHACGHEHPCQFTGIDIEISTGVNMFDPLEKIIGYEKVTIPTEELNDILKY